jgi:hypothetical protein
MTKRSRTFFEKKRDTLRNIQATITMNLLLLLSSSTFPVWWAAAPSAAEQPLINFDCSGGCLERNNYVVSRLSSVAVAYRITMT